MRAIIDSDGCIACGLCVETCPKVFRMSDDGYAEVYVETIPVQEEDGAMEAQNNCPVSVITVE